ncbi:MAG: hypothetical protein JXM68_14550 [Sedimentisphaerales bacterium]|nr:hypothetical protein [Sedimentisphaerales bacterium]
MHYSDNFKRVHFGNTLLFVLCIAGIAVQSLRQAGLDWWLIFSISGYSALTVLFFLGGYIFAIFRGMNRHSEPDIEHPVTSLKMYKIIYSCTPLLGFATGLLAQIGLTAELNWKNWILNGQLGSFWITIFIWVILDPAIAMLEGFSPAGAQSRHKRQEKARFEREQIVRKRTELLAELSQKEKSETIEQKKALDGPADELSDLILGGLRGTAGANHPAVIDLGVRAWQIGGIKCMKLLREMAWEKCQNKGLRPGIVDEIDYWWDGIGDWRSKSL